MRRLVFFAILFFLSLVPMQPARVAERAFGRLSVAGRTLLEGERPVRGLMAH